MQQYRKCDALVKNRTQVKGDIYTKVKSQESVCQESLEKQLEDPERHPTIQ